MISLWQRATCLLLFLPISKWGCSKGGLPYPFSIFNPALLRNNMTWSLSVRCCMLYPTEIWYPAYSSCKHIPGLNYLPSVWNYFSRATDAQPRAISRWKPLTLQDSGCCSLLKAIVQKLLFSEHYSYYTLPGKIHLILNGNWKNYFFFLKQSLHRAHNAGGKHQCPKLCLPENNLKYQTTQFHSWVILWILNWLL